MLSASALTQAGPILLETAIKHYFNRKQVTKDSKARDEFLFDEAFVLVKAFLEISTRHTVEELQKFSLTKTPSPPWVLLHRVLIPLEPTCSQASEILIHALGGEEESLKMAGGTKWWTVRSQAGVEAEWIGIKKDFKREEERYQKVQRKKTQLGKALVDEKDPIEGKKKKKKKKNKEKGKQSLKEKEEDDEQEGEFTEEMDHLRCMLYIHGGAYYWGSINTHRYTIWRYARKMRGRCFAVNYRKAPQFPWPCALQDCIAAYLYLIRPPPGAKHRPIDPRNLIIAGDSAGGGLVLALLQVIRDEGLPTPAGAVLISPWCDLTHSFPSILQNTATDIMPPYGFIHKPSTLWPPPNPALTEEVQSRLRQKVSEAVHRLSARTDSHKLEGDLANRSGSQDERSEEISSATDLPAEKPSDYEDITSRGDTIIGEITDKQHESTLYPVAEKGVEHHPGPTDDSHAPSYADPAGADHQVIKLQVNGQDVAIRSQIQLYCTNNQLTHPLVSPVLGYLGGLPPLLVIVSDKEVLRDEIIYAAHKAARPSQYPVKDSVKVLCPSLNGIEDRFGPTQVHLQVYDNTCHVLPLFSMCEPAKHAYRSIANFCRYVTTEHRSPSSSLPGSQGYRQASVPNPRQDGSITNLTLPIHSATGPAVASGLDHAESPTSTINNMTASPITTTPPSPSAVDSTEVASPVETIASPLKLGERSRQSSFRDTFRRYLLGANARDRRSSFRTQDASDVEGVNEDAMSESGSISTPLNSPPNELESGLPNDDLDMPLDELKMPKDIPPGFAGNALIYSRAEGRNPYTDNMIRERVAGRGQCRLLEPAKDLPGLNVPLDEIGVIKEGPAMRYLNGQQLWDHKYAHTARRIAKRRLEHLKRAELDAHKATERWAEYLRRKREEEEHGDFDQNRYLFENEFSWTWALKSERPPPTAIIARRDTTEARTLARLADRMVDPSVHLGGLALWSAMASFFSKESGSSTNADSPTSAKDRLRGRIFRTSSAEQVRDL